LHANFFDAVIVGCKTQAAAEKRGCGNGSKKVSPVHVRS
jgi:hypothetical protein